MGLLSTIKAKLLGQKESSQNQVVITPETYNVSTNISQSLQKSLIYWHLRGKVGDDFITRKINPDDADKLIKHIKKIKQ